MSVYRWKPTGKGASGWDKSDLKKYGKIALIAAIVIVVLIGVFTSFYTVDDKQQAVLTTFGKVTDVTGPGLHFKLPFGIQKAQKVDVNVYQKIEIGYSSEGAAVEEGESMMITGDDNIVNVDFFVEYRITDPVKFLYASNDPEMVLRNLIQSQIRNVVGSSSVDSVLTDGKEGIQQQVRELVSEVLLEYDIGLTLVDVRIQDAEPPTQAVNEAFKSVENAKQQKQTAINDAVAYENGQIPQAEAEVDRLTKEAEYLKTKRENEAKEQVALFNAMFQEYQNNPEITKSRMYYEVIAKIFPGVKLVINTGSGETVDMLLPLDPMVSTGGNES